MYPFPRKSHNPPNSDDFLKKLEECRAHWMQCLITFSSDFLHNFDQKDWRWRRRLKPGMIIDAFCATRYTWCIAKIVEEFDQLSHKNVITVRFYRDYYDDGGPLGQLNSHVQRLNKYVCFFFIFYIIHLPHSDMVICLHDGEHIQTTKC